MEAIGRQKRQVQNLLGKLLFRLLKPLILISILAALPLGSQAAGVTIITHGYNSGTTTWVDAMALAIRSRTDFPGTQSTTYRVNVTRFFQFELDVTHQLVAGGDPLLADSGEIIILLDWHDIDTFGLEETGTGDVAEAVVEKLLDANFISGLNKSLVEFPVHLIGHSRGGSLVTALARVLGQSGVVVDHVTTLDPHPLSWDEHSAQDSTEVSRFANVVFADNYYEHSFGTFPMGNPVSGAKNINLSLIVSGVGAEAHTDMHTYYHGTVDTTTQGPIDGRDILDSWYEHLSTGPRGAVGYCWSRQVGTDRPREAVSVDYGGFVGSGVSITPNANPQWPNVIIKDVTDTTVTVGSPLKLSCWYRDTDSSGTIAVYLDAHRNPYNLFASHLSQASENYTATSGSPSTRDISASTSGVTPDTYYLCLKITDGSGLTRYDYWREPIVVSPIGVTVQTSHSGQGLDFTVDGTVYNSPQSFEWLDGTAHTLSVVPSQQGNDGRQYVFQKWSDNNTSTTRSVTAIGNATYTAVYSTSDAIEFTGEAVADSNVSSKYPDSNFGSSHYLTVYDYTSPNGQRDSLIRFDLSSIPPGSAISYVSLRLTAFTEGGNTDGNGPDIGIQRIRANWDEDTVKWINQPAMAPYIGSANLSGNAVWDFTSSQMPGLISIVHLWVNTPATNYGLNVFGYQASSAGVHDITFYSREATESPTLIVHYTPPPDSGGDPIVNLRAKKSSSGSSISPNNWQRDNDPYFYWETTNTISPVIGYSIQLDTDPTNYITVPYFSYPSDSVADGSHTFKVKSLDAEGNWGPEASFVIEVDTTPPTNGTISVNDDAASTWSPTVILNNLGAWDIQSGVVQMKFSNDGATWTAYESIASSKSNWELFNNGGDTNVGNKTVYVRYKDDAGNESTMFSDTIVFDPGPAITSQPDGRVSVAAASDLTLEAGVTGYPLLHFQWLRNGAAITNGNRINGADTSKLAISTAEMSDAGGYVLLITNSYGSITSQVCRVRVVPAVSLLQIAAVTNLSGAAQRVAVLGNYVFVATDESIEIVDISIPSRPTRVGFVTEPSSWFRLEGRYLLVPPVAFDISNPSMPSEVKLEHVDPSAAYVATWGESETNLLRWRARLDVLGDWKTDLVLRGEIAVVGDARGITTLDVADPENSVEIGFHPSEWWWWSPGLERVKGVGSNAYALAAGNSDVIAHIVVFDVHDPSNPSVASVTGFGLGFGAWRWRDIALSLPHAFVVGGEKSQPGVNSLTVYDNSDLTDLVLVGGLSLDAQANGVAVDGQNVYVATDSALIIFSRDNDNQEVPQIIFQPQKRTNLLGDSTGIGIMASGSFPLCYQWYQNGVVLVEKTNAWLSFTNIQVSQAGQYYVVVTNAFGSTTTAVASITVRLHPIIEPAGSRLGFESGKFGFNINALSNDTVVIESSANLMQWVPVQTNVVPSNGIIEFRDTNAVIYPWLFYRARLF